jgi:hypothetical protein
MGGFKGGAGAVQPAQVVVWSFDSGNIAPSARILHRRQQQMEIKPQFHSLPIDDTSRPRVLQRAPVHQAMSPLAVLSPNRDNSHSYQCAMTGGFSRHRSAKQRPQGILTAFERNRQQ